MCLNTFAKPFIVCFYGGFIVCLGWEAVDFNRVFFSEAVKVVNFDDS